MACNDLRHLAQGFAGLLWRPHERPGRSSRGAKWNVPLGRGAIGLFGPALKAFLASRSRSHTLIWNYYDQIDPLETSENKQG
jgi:hypothetical protein